MHTLSNLKAIFSINDDERDLNLNAETFDSGFPLSHDTYNGMHCAANGLVYYVLCSENVEEGGKMYSFDPKTSEIKLCGDLTEACGEGALRAVPQGKSHVNFIESDGKLFFSTHIGYYTMQQGMDKMGVPPQGYQPYPGGHLLAYDMHSGQFTDLCKAPHHEGVLTMNMDSGRKLIYGITWPTGYFFRYDMNTGKRTDFGKISEEGENGFGENFRALCRCIAINPENGYVYFSVSEGTIFYCKPEEDRLSKVTNDNLHKDYFGYYDPATPGHMGYNWRQIFWYEPERCFYGVHGNSGYLFRFLPYAEHVELVERITSIPSRRSGTYDQFSYGYLGFALGPDQETIYYLTGAPVFQDGKRVAGKAKTAKGEAKGLEHLHLITYNIKSGTYIDHGSILLPDGKSPLYVNSIAIGNDYIYFMGRITQNNKMRVDLMRIPDPHSVL